MTVNKKSAAFLDQTVSDTQENIFMALISDDNVLKMTKTKKIRFEAYQFDHKVKCFKIQCPDKDFMLMYKST